jgi:phosphoserine aminotransferase
MNFLEPTQTAAYTDTGHWAAEAMEYARYYGNTFVAASAQGNNYNHLPAIEKEIPANCRYLHITTNNTIYGTQYRQPPATSLPLVADMSSDILSETRDYSAYSMFYAAVQKNLGTPGVALAVIRRDFLEQASASLPPLFSYKAQVKEKSVLNTANVSGIYLSLLMLRWIKERTVARIEQDNILKAGLLYKTLDDSNIFTPHVAWAGHRSRMNVCFTACDTQTEKAFLARCSAEGITGIAGHRLIGGFRVSLYNAITPQQVMELVEVMKDFENKY